MAPVQPDNALAAVVGTKPIPRTEVTKKLWNYIKKHDLQDANKRTMIKADANLKPIFGGKAR
ncbi:MAG: SWIB/MDM2 domain-containing protein, partial [Phycisphaerae bacterium]